MAIHTVWLPYAVMRSGCDAFPLIIIEAWKLMRASPPFVVTLATGPTSGDHTKLVGGFSEYIPEVPLRDVQERADDSRLLGREALFCAPVRHGSSVHVDNVAQGGIGGLFLCRHGLVLIKQPSGRLNPKPPAIPRD
jgi:hypothetical protein